MSEFLGSRISLVSKSDIRYVGILHEINSDESTVSLENVRSFGTEGRRGRAEDEIGPSDQVYEYIVFRGSDVKDLRIEDHPSMKENKAPMPDDPAIVGARQRPAGRSPNQNAPPGAGQFLPQGPYHPNNNFYGGQPPPAQWGRGGPPMPGPGFGNMPYPPPPGWFPPGGQFPPGPGGPPHWNNQNFPPGPGGPPAPVPQGRPPQELSGQGTKSDAPDKSSAPSAQPAPPSEPKSLAQVARQPSNAPTPPVESKPSADEVKAAATAGAASGAPVNAPQAGPAPTGPRKNGPMPVIPLSGPATKPFQLPGYEKQVAAKVAVAAAPQTSVQDATDAARAAVAVAMSQLGSAGLNHVSLSNGAMDNLTTKVQEMRVNSRGGGPRGRGRGGYGGQGGRPQQGKVEVPRSDFDFAESNAKFSKEDVVKEAIAGSPAAETPEIELEAAKSGGEDDQPAPYNKSRSFFDNIGSEAKERASNGGQKMGGREWRGEEQRKNMETFGQGSVDGGYRNNYGRGRGRGRGRGGYGRGRGGPRPQYQSAPQV